MIFNEILRAQLARVKKCAALVALAAVACSHASATVLYVRFSSHEIVIGADSRRTLENGESYSVCKIRRIGDTFVSSAGVAESDIFNPTEIARQAITTSRTLGKAGTKFEQLIEQPLIDVLKVIKGRDRARYEAFKQGAAFNIFFVKFKDQPELIATSFTPIDRQDGSIILDKNTTTLVGGVKGSIPIFVGISKRAESLHARPSLWSKGSVTGVRRVLQISIEDNSESGEPIDIVQITKSSSARWYPREPGCDDKGRRE
jgi:hypothetical protein